MAGRLATERRSKILEAIRLNGSVSVNDLARDLDVLTAGGYRVQRIQPVDMFPFTEHVETVCLLTHKD